MIMKITHDERFMAVLCPERKTLKPSSASTSHESIFTLVNGRFSACITFRVRYKSYIINSILLTLYKYKPTEQIHLVKQTNKQTKQKH